MSALKIVVIATGYVLILVVSLPSFRLRWQHALPRSLAFILVLALAVVNAGAWLEDPISPLHILSWILLAGSIPLALYPLILLRRYGQPAGNIDYTTALVRRGIYRFIRHPLYLSLIVLALGSLLKQVNLGSAVLTSAACGLLYLTARLEESFNLDKFGQSYADYTRETKMFIPGIL